ncbi:MAG: hypothetical protein WCB67_05330 [Solirubrobacteraceae bacterium]
MPDVPGASYRHDVSMPIERSATVTPSITSLVAAEHIAELRRGAVRLRPDADPSLPITSISSQSPVVVLRLAGPDDAHFIERLAALDGAPTLEGRVLLALNDDEAVAALSLLDGRVVANPFVATNDAVGLLRLRAEHLWQRRARRRLRAIPWPRFA